MMKTDIFLQKQEPQNLAQLVQPVDTRQSSQQQTSPIISEFLSLYTSQTQKHKVSNSNITQLEMCLLKNGIQIDRRYFNETLQAELINYTCNFQALNIRVCFGYFKMTISVLNVDGVSQCHNFPQLHHNSNSNLFFFQDRLYKKHTVKCLQLNHNDFTETFSSAIKQFCILKIAAALRIGPKVSDLLGFDLIIYEQCVEFAMQNCKKIQGLSQEDQWLLKSKLSILHAFNLVHIDIKPSNIMLSPSLKQIVFIDFGLSQHIEQRIGIKSKVKFSGSLSYCGKQMRKAYQRNEYLYIDLYYNDFQCLATTYTQMFQPGVQENEQVNNYEQNQLALTILLHFEKYFKKAELNFTYIRVKYYLFSFVQFDKAIIRQKQFLSKYYFALNDFAKNLSNSTYLRYVKNVFHQLQLKNGLSYSNINCMFKFQYRPIIYQLSDKRQDSVQDTHFIKVAKHLLDFKLNEGNRDYCFLNQENKRKVWLLSQQVVNSFGDVNYLIKSYADYVDFRKTQSTFTQKVAASVLIIKKLGLKTNIEGDQRYILSSCQKQLLFRYIELKPSYYEQVIPLFLRNLIILNYLSCQEVLVVGKTVLGESIDSKQKLKLKIRLQTIFVLFVQQNLWYQNPTTLIRTFNQLFRIKVQQPFSTPLKGTSIKIINNMRRSSSCMHEEIKKLFEGIYLEDSFIDQVTIWRTIYLQAAYQMNQTVSQQFQWFKIELAYAYHKKYCLEFDFYYFSSLFFPNVHLSNRIMRLVYTRMSACIGRTDILKQFVIYYLFWSKQLKKQPIQQQIVYHAQIIAQVIQRYQQFQQKGNNSFSLKFLLDKRQHQALSQIFFFCVSNRKNETIQRIFHEAKKIITKDILRQITRKLQQNLETNQKNFYRNSSGSVFFSLICFYYQNLYKDEPFLIDQLSNFCMQIDKQLASIVFRDKLMQIHFDYSLLHIRLKIYELQDKMPMRIQAFEDFILKHLNNDDPLSFINSDFFNRPFILYIYNSIQMDSQVIGLKALQFYYETVMKYRQFRTLFALNRFDQSWHYLIQYVVFYKDAKTLIYLHNCLSLYLQRNPYFNFIKDYIQSFSLGEYPSYQQRLKECWQQLGSYYINWLPFGNNYIIIFYVFLLSHLKIDRYGSHSQFSKKLLIYICQRVSKLNTYAHKYVLKQLYEYLYLKDPSKLCLNKKYLKYNQKKLNFAAFKKIFNFRYSKVQQRDNVYLRSLQAKLGRFYDINKN